MMAPSNSQFSVQKTAFKLIDFRVCLLAAACSMIEPSIENK